DTLRETGDAFLCRKLNRVRVVGISEPVRIYEVLDFAGDAAVGQRTMVELFHEALALFEKREWQAAEAGFQKVLDQTSGDPPSRVYLERCSLYRTSPPPEDWDGVFDWRIK
ncbi:MAG: adenylate/guanylate cyclase domain-containing response regulator, partial [Treponema sp.]|nr:adenylate/guanylate cyclase domain-containing response regulator [Treponema sp.]